MNEVRKCYLYVLIHTETNELFYVGRGTVNPKGQEIRGKVHIWRAKRGSPLPVHRKIRRILNEQGNIKFEVRATGLTLEEAMVLERNLIAAIGLDNLTNVSPGGDDFVWIWGRDKEYKKTSAVRTPEWIENQRKASHKRAVVLEHLQVKRVLYFDSLRCAAEHLQVDKNAVWQAVQFGRVTCGYRARYANEDFRAKRKYAKNSKQARVSVFDTLN